MYVFTVNRDMIKAMETSVKDTVAMVRQMRKIAIAKFVIPFCFAGAVVLLFWFAGPEVYTDYAKVFGIYSFMPIGGAVAVIPVGLNLGIPPAYLISFILFTDADVALFLVWNFKYANKIPVLGKLVVITEEKGEKAIKKYKWAMRFGFIGLMLFVIFPLQWTGSAVGAMAGRLIGMTAGMTWLAVVAGCFIRSLLATLICIGVISFL
ncbi:putative membrane protein [Candidatus Methanophagaceae archaeon]|nr:putative membrane protein [Methanophagales archaeon]